MYVKRTSAANLAARIVGADLEPVFGGAGSQGL